MQALGIDIGTTSICGVVLDAQSGTVLRVENRKNDSFLPPTAPFAKEQDVQKITAQIDALLDVLYDEKTIGVIGVTGQMHGIVYLDQHGAPCSPLYTWQDGRGNETDENGVTYADRLHGATGFGLVTDLYNEEHGLIAPQAVTFCTIHDYIAMRMCQNHAPLIHTSDAASFGAYDAQTHRFLVHNDRLPNVVNDFRVIGTYHDTPVCVAIGDNQASFLGTAGESCALINVGTGSQISIPVQGYCKTELLETRPLCGEDYILVGSSLCGGRAFAILEHFFADVVQMATGTRPENLYPAMDEMLKTPHDTTVRIDPRFSGTRTDPSLRARILELSEDNFTARDLCWAMLWGMTDELYTLYTSANIDFKQFVGSGNGLRRNQALRHCMEQRFGSPIRFSKNREEAAVGAAMSGLCAVGEYRNWKEIAQHIPYQTDV